MNENKTLTVSGLFSQKNVQKKFQEILGSKSQGFITSVLQITSGNSYLANADPMSIYNAAATAATLDLPINNNLGFAWIVPYKGKAQFQIGWKGFVQLAQRTGQYLKINVVEVYANQFKSWNSLTEDLDADFSLDGAGDVVGYCAYFKLLNGFDKTSYWSKSKVDSHAKKYSQAYASEKGVSPWKDKDQYHEMAKKTVLKNTLNKWGILSIEMQKAVLTDQSVINNPDTVDVTYVDHNETETSSDKSASIKNLAEDSANKIKRGKVMSRITTLKAKENRTEDESLEIEMLEAELKGM